MNNLHLWTRDHYQNRLICPSPKMHFILRRDKWWWISVLKVKCKRKILATLSAFHISSIKIFLDNRPMLAKYFTELCTSSYTGFFPLYLYLCGEHCGVRVYAFEPSVNCSSLAPSCVSAWIQCDSPLEGAEDTHCYSQIQRQHLKRVSGSEPSD